MSTIFMSYSRKNLAAVKDVGLKLELAGHQVWFDQDLSGGERWWSTILQRIRTSDVFVQVLTPESLESEACRREFEYAHELNRPVLPLRLSSAVNANLLAPPLNEYQILDHQAQDPQAPFALMGAITRLAAEAGPLPHPLPAPPAMPESYRGSLLARIDTARPLNAAAQKELVFELEQLAREGRPEEEIRELVRRFRRRPELLVLVADRLDALFAEPAPKADAAPAAQEKPEADRSPETAGIRAILRETASRLLRGGEVRLIEVDENNRILLSGDHEDGLFVLSAEATVRDDAGGGRTKALKDRGWKSSAVSTVKGVLAGGVLAATNGLAALALLSKSVRDEIMSNDMSRAWKIADPSADLEKAVDDLQFAIEIMVPQVQSISVSQAGGEPLAARAAV